MASGGGDDVLVSGIVFLFTLLGMFSDDAMRFASFVSALANFLKSLKRGSVDLNRVASVIKAAKGLA